MDLRLNGLRALVTGGTKGIGRSIVETLVDEGSAVAFCARTGSEVRQAEDELRQRGGNVHGAVADVADGPALEQWVSDAAGSLDGVDIVVANVSALAIPNSTENWRASFEVDVLGAVRLVEAAMPHLERSGEPAIVTISSVSGREVDFAAGPYGSAKAALIHYTQGLAYQLAAKGIRANSVSPGNVFFAGGVWDNIQRNNTELYDHALSLNPTGRMCRPDEVARATAFLGSPAASFITGTNLVVDGALTRGVQF